MSEVEIVRAVHRVNGSVISAPLDVIQAFGSQWVIDGTSLVEPTANPAEPKDKPKGKSKGQGKKKPVEVKQVPAQDTF